MKIIQTHLKKLTKQIFWLILLRSVIIIEIRIHKRMEMSSKKRVNTSIAAAIVSTRGPIYCQATVIFHNSAEVNFRDFLPTTTGVEIGTNDSSSYAD